MMKKNNAMKKIKGNSDKGLLQSLIKVMGTTQNQLAQKSEIKRDRIKYLNNQSWGCFTLEDIDRISKGFQVEPTILIKYLKGIINDEISLSQPKEPFHRIKYNDGSEYVSFSPNSKKFDIGKLTISSKTTLPRSRVPRSNLIFFLVQNGSVEITLLNTHCFDAGHCFKLIKPVPYELHNPTNRSITLFLVSLPSLLFYVPDKGWE